MVSDTQSGSKPGTLDHQLTIEHEESGLQGRSTYPNLGLRGV